MLAGVEEVETWVWVMYNEPGGINAYSADWSRNGFTYYDLFWNTSRTIKQHSPKMTVGGLSDGPEQGAILAAQMNEMPEHKPLLDFFSYHHCELYRILPVSAIATIVMVEKRVHTACSTQLALR